ncbi:hypothetical protein WN50_07330 [Limnoraphis robusta CS-951]|uniref:Putative restriction endonuclease domain-containing protein n=1 Tax=Limnoraphis robusta CS-951 TaxID=1637645 RepID=A0A0F5YIL6_9CYAN|nr:hypothetical protein WN50_07330 [Limnoraphis robusta CS-951]
MEEFPNWQDEVQAPDLSHIITEDDTPMDNIFSEKQQRLLVSSIYSSFSPGIPFLATANIGLFYGLNKPPLVPDVLLSLEVEMPQDWSQKQNRSYFVWQQGKPPELAVEMVSNKVGKELGSKLKDYAHAGVAYYVIFDPLQQILRENEKLRIYQLQGGQYVEFENHFLELIQLGLTLWDGAFEGQQHIWLRWCDREGEILRTGDERAENERQRAEKLAQLLRERGINPDD